MEWEGIAEGYRYERREGQGGGEEGERGKKGGKEKGRVIGGERMKTGIERGEVKRLRQKKSQEWGRKGPAKTSAGRGVKGHAKTVAGRWCNGAR